MIKSFSGQYEFLSNFFSSEVTMYGKVFPTVEHAFQAAKSLFASERELIRLAPTPGQAKRMGRKVNLRPDWEQDKVHIMTVLVSRKFEILELRKLLSETSGELIEGNTWHDNFWGDCFCEKCKATVGQNHLGKILMKIREMI